MGIIPKRPLGIPRIPATAPSMTDILLYDCPSCTVSCSVAPDLVGLTVVCPHCSQEFTATPPESADFQLPETIPFFKSGKLELLKNHLNKLTSDGELSKSDEIALTRAALMLGLKTELTDLFIFSRLICEGLCFLNYISNNLMSKFDFKHV